MPIPAVEAEWPFYCQNADLKKKSHSSTGTGTGAGGTGAGKKKGDYAVKVQYHRYVADFIGFARYGCTWSDARDRGAQV